MIHLFTDFGLQDWYVGQVRTVLARMAPAVPVIDLMHGLAPYDVQSASYLLCALAERLPAGDIVLGVVDPGVGGSRRPLAVEANQRWFVGPDNGLFNLVWRRVKSRRAFSIDWRPDALSSSFHGRDLFAPVAAMLACGQAPAMTEIPDPILPPDWPDDLWRVIHVDRYGNAVTGIRGEMVDDVVILKAGGRHFRHQKTFGAAPSAVPFWYRNSLGLVELAYPSGNLSAETGLRHGCQVDKVK